MNPVTLSIGTAAVVFCLTALVFPLVRYIVIAKDHQIDELKSQLLAGNKEHDAFQIRMHELEIQVTKFKGEVELANGIQSRLDRFVDRLEDMNRELGAIQAQLNLLTQDKAVHRLSRLKQS